MNRRGQGPFDPRALIEALGPLGSEANPALKELSEYNAFYGLHAAEWVPGTRQRVGWLYSGRHDIATQHFLHPDPVGSAVVCHGYFDHVGLYGHLIRFLLEQGLSVIAFDQPGHGLSSGERASIGSFDEYVDVLKDVIAHHADELADRRFLFGQSMGGAIAMEYLAGRPELDFHRLVLLAPLIRPSNWRLLRWVHLFARRLVRERPRILTDNAENPEFLDLIRQDPLTPMVLPIAWVSAMASWIRRFEAREVLPLAPLVVQGQADRTVDWQHNLNWLRTRAEPIVLEIPSARHHLVNESEAIRSELFGWLSERLFIGGPAESGDRE